MCISLNRFIFDSTFLLGRVFFSKLLEYLNNFATGYSVDQDYLHLVSHSFDTRQPGYILPHIH